MGGWRWAIECRGWDDQQLANGRVLTTAHDILVYFGAPRVKVVADADDVETWEQNAPVKFAAALKQALEAFAVTHNSGPSTERVSPLDLILQTPQAYGLDETTPVAAATALLRAYLAADQSAEVALLTPTVMQQQEYRTPPGLGESLTDNWVFRIRLPNTFNRLIWCIVDRFGRHPAYSYVSA